MSDVDELQPWDRIKGSRDPYKKGESKAAHHAFLHYRDLGPKRSIDAAYREHRSQCLGRQNSGKRASGTWSKWASEWNWVERVEAWDNHLELVRRAEMEAKEREAAAFWDAERNRVRQDEIDLAKALIARAREMLAHPITEKKTVVEDLDGVTIETTIIEPARWNYNSIAKILEIADKLQRLAAEMETDRHTLDIETRVRELAIEAGLDPDEAIKQAEEVIRATRR